MAITVDRVNQVLAGIVDPNTGKDLASSRSARNVRVDGDAVAASMSNSAIRPQARSNQFAGGSSTR